MGKLPYYIFCLAISLMSCSGIGTKFFVRNYEPNPVKIRYTYFEKAEFTDTMGFSYAPKLYVLISNSLLTKKIFKKFPYCTASYFDTLPCTKINNLSYEINLPPGSTLYIAPVYNYGDNIRSIAINDSVRIEFVPSVENTALTQSKLMKRHYSLVGNNYFLINLKLAELDSVLHQ